MPRVYWLETKSEFLKLARMRTYCMSTLGFPLMFYAFFGVAMGTHGNAGTMPMAKYLLATYGAFAVVAAALYAFGVGVAVERGLGWLQVKRASPMPPAAYFIAKGVVSAMFGAAVVALLFAMGAAFAEVRMPAAQWLSLGAVLIAGSLPFSALGLAIGNFAGPNSAPGVVNLVYLPMSFLAGLWIPLDFLPAALKQFAPLLPTYHFGQIALAVLGAPIQGTVLEHAGALAGFGLIFAGVAWIGNSRDREKVYGWNRAMRLLPKGHDWTPYAYLIYFVYFILSPFLYPTPAWYKALSMAGTAAALALYFIGYWLKGKKVLWVTAGFVVLGVAFIPSNPAAAVLFVYAVCYPGRALEAGEAYRWLALVVAIVAVETPMAKLPPYAWIPAIVFPIMIGATIIHQQQKERLTKSLLMAQDEAARLAQIAERERIGRDLHDLLGHTLSVIILKSELASKLAAADPARAAEEIREVERISREALAEVRAAVQGYRSGGIEREVAQARSALDAAGIRLDATIEERRLPPAQETVLAMALREAVTNVVRHAHATACRMTLRRQGPWCELEVADDGRGGELPEGNGLSGMRQRVEALGGVLERDGSAGARLRIRVPV